MKRASALIKQDQEGAAQWSDNYWEPLRVGQENEPHQVPKNKTFSLEFVTLGGSIFLDQKKWRIAIGNLDSIDGNRYLSWAEPKKSNPSKFGNL